MSDNVLEFTGDIAYPKQRELDSRIRDVIEQFDSEHSDEPLSLAAVIGILEMIKQDLITVNY